MKSTGVMRRVDELGRIVLPKELRMSMHIHLKDPLEVFVGDNDTIILRKYQPGCVFCESMEHLTTFKGLHVCRACIQALTKVLETETPA